MLSEIQKKSKDEKRQIAYIATFVIGIVIFSIWMLMTSYNIKQAIDIQSIENQSQTIATIKNSLPSIKQTDSVTTELVKKRKEADETPVEDKKGESLFEKLFR